MIDAHTSSDLPGATPDPSRGAAMRKVALALIAVGGLLSLLALTSETGRNRLGFAYLLGFVFCWAIVLGSLFFVALQHITRSVWSVVLRRVAEMFAAPMWLVALLFVPVVLFAVLHDRFGLFPWADPLTVEGDAVLEGKVPYLNLPFWVIRAVVFFTIWIAFAGFFVRQSLKQDEGEAGAGATLRMRKIAAPFLVIFGLTMTFASFDWLMSLEPHWFSTIFGVYVFAGMTLSALAAITLTVVELRSKGILGEDLVRPDHLYSLGGLLFAFTCFWAYIAFSQFMLIWYGNIPEETIYFVHRVEHGWLTVSVLLAILRFAVPFFLLLARGSKMNPRRLAVVSVLVLAGQLLDLYWLIMPQVHVHAPALGWQELGPPILLAGILVLYVARFLGRHGLVAAGDPMLEKSRHFHL
jgi:hypothetical protein